MTKEYSYQGNKWRCEYSEPSGYWVAILTTPHSVIAAASWKELKESIKAFDPANPRVDAVAICDPLPPMGSKAGF